MIAKKKTRMITVIIIMIRPSAARFVVIQMADKTLSFRFIRNVALRRAAIVGVSLFVRSFFLFFIKKIFFFWGGGPSWPFADSVCLVFIGCFDVHLFASIQTLGFTGFYWGFTGFHWVSLGFTRFY